MEKNKEKFNAISSRVTNFDVVKTVSLKLVGIFGDIKSCICSRVHTDFYADCQNYSK